MIEAIGGFFGASVILSAGISIMWMAVSRDVGGSTYFEGLMGLAIIGAGLILVCKYLQMLVKL